MCVSWYGVCVHTCVCVCVNVCVVDMWHVCVCVWWTCGVCVCVWWTCGMCVCVWWTCGMCMYVRVCVCGVYAHMLAGKCTHVCLEARWEKSQQEAGDPALSCFASFPWETVSPTLGDRLVSSCSGLPGAGYHAKPSKSVPGIWTRILRLAQ
jgi:hypothetical protein